ncbi:MAG: hypothetical protein ACYTG2_14100 [Planctomycetota bacterium]|jgi:hypothetical protein
MASVEWIVGAAGIYLAIGLVFALAFVWRGVSRVDPAAAGGSLGFRLLIVPGAAALWPLLLRRWMSGARRPPAPRDPHRLAARAAKQP